MLNKIYATKGNANRAARNLIAKDESLNGQIVVKEVQGGFQVTKLKLHREPSLKWRQFTKVRGGVVARVWDHFDANADLSRKDLINAGIQKGFATNTLRTQYTQWSKMNAELEA